MKTSQEIESRLAKIDAFLWGTFGHRHPAIRVVSIEWDSDPEIFHFYVHGNCVDQVQQNIEEEFSHVDPVPAGVRYKLQILRVDAPQQVLYNGECIYARWEEFVSPPPFFQNRSQITRMNVQSLRNFKIIKTIRNPQLQGSGELIEFQEPIGYYFNPTIQEKTATCRAITYHDKNHEYVIPASPHFEWLEEYKLRFIETGRTFHLSWHIIQESLRGLLGRISPAVLCAKIMWNPAHIRYYYQEELSTQDRENLELAWLEVAAGLPETLDFDIEFKQIPATHHISARGTTLYCKQECHFDTRPDYSMFFLTHEKVEKILKTFAGSGLPKKGVMEQAGYDEVLPCPWKIGMHKAIIRNEHTQNVEKIKEEITQYITIHYITDDGAAFLTPESSEVWEKIAKRWGADREGFFID
jgi:hypothetical protein